MNLAKIMVQHLKLDITPMLTVCMVVNFGNSGFVLQFFKYIGLVFECNFSFGLFEALNLQCYDLKCFDINDFHYISESSLAQKL